MRNLAPFSPRVLIMLVILATLFSNGSNTNADQVTFINGDRISGQIIHVFDGKIQIATEYAGTIETDFEMVADLTTEAPCTITLRNGDVVRGRIYSMSDGLIIVISDILGELKFSKELFVGLNVPETTVEGSPEFLKLQAQLQETQAALTEAELDLEKKEETIEGLSSPYELWSGSVSLGLTFERGNTDNSKLRFDSRATRTAPGDELRLRLTIDYEESSGDVDTNKVFGQSKLKVFQSDRRYVFGLTDLEYDQLKDLDLRAQAYAGPGYYFIKKERTSLAGEIGAGLVAEFFDNDDGTKDSYDGRLWLSSEWRQKIFDDTEFSQILTYFPSMEDIGDYRIKYEAVLTTPIGKHWAWKLSFLEEYDSEPDGEDTEKFDTTLISAIEYTF